MSYRDQARRRNVPGTYTLVTSPQWRDWLHHVAMTTRTPKPVLIDQAMILYAREHGFAPPPARCGTSRPWKEGRREGGEARGCYPLMMMYDCLDSLT
jgi:hypothetical protein